MRLLALHVENFGTLQGFDLSPAEGLNVLYQKNGWGKSTLAVFIKAMLYGLPATSKRSLDENERKKYTPWQGGAFGGSIEFETDRGTFRAERFFGAKEAQDSFALYDLSTNLPSTAYSEALGEELFGIDADGFERSVYLSQRTLSGGRDNSSITAKLGDLLDDAEDVGSFDGAMAALDKRRKFYTLTGGRGAIAETEAEILKLQGELEHCMRVEETLRLREEELAKCTAALQSAETEAREVRSSMQKAGLARERAALSEQKSRMQAELSELSRRRERINDFFRNAPPSSEELAEGKRLYEEIKDAKARLDAIPAEIPEANTLAALRRRYPKGAPDARTLERIEQDNGELITLRAKYAAMTEHQTDDPILSRFPDGAPDSIEIEEAYNSLRQADRLKKEIEGAHAQLGANKPRPHLAILSAVLLCIGALLSAIAFLPSLRTLLIPALVAGCALLVTGAILSILASAKKRQYRSLLIQAEQTEKSREAEVRRLIGGVGEMLAAYGWHPASEEDLARGLGELSAQSFSYWEAQKKVNRTEEERRAFSQAVNTLSARLHTVFSSFHEDLPYKTDYRAELDLLYRELDKLSELESLARAHATERARAEQVLRERQAALLPFLHRFDPAGKMRAGECLNYVSEQYNEYHRLGREIDEKRAAMAAFVAEKQLDTAPAPTDAGEYDRLVALEKELQARISDLERRRTMLKNDVDHLSDEVDRIPELTHKQEGLKSRLAEYKANAATISTTAKLLEEAKTALSTRYLGGMQESFTKFLSHLTQTAPDAVMDASFDVRLREGGQTRPMESFSRGWRDAVEFCTHLSLTDALYKDGEKPFLMLDDPFVNLDDERLPAARALLEELASDYQILYFVCHKDRI